MIKVFKEASAKRIHLIVALCSSTGACSSPTISYKPSRFLTRLLHESFLFNTHALARNNGDHGRDILQLPITLQVRSGLFSDSHGSNIEKILFEY